MSSLLRHNSLVVHLTGLEESILKTASMSNMTMNQLIECLVPIVAQPSMSQSAIF